MSKRAWTVEAVRDTVTKRFNQRACLFQIQIAMAVYCDRKDVVACAPTGAGKTLSFWIPLLMAAEEGLRRVVLVVTPLNLLGKQNETDLAAAGIRAVAVDGENQSAQLWKVRPHLPFITTYLSCTVQ